jgi:pimeloyl-ACP methyl ester carboxylesterase
VKTEFLELPDGSLAYSDHGGEGEIVLMLPGMAALRSEYRILAPYLAEAGYRSVTADLRGQGESSVPWPRYDVPSVGADILALIDQLGGGPAHVIGTSFAPGAAVWAAAERPERIRSLVLIGAFVRDARLNPLVRAGAWLLMNNPWRVPAWIMYYRRLYPSAKPPDFDEYLGRLRENLSDPRRFAAARALGDSSRRPAEERLERVDRPALVVMGTKDPDFPDPAGEARWMAEKLRAQLLLVEGAGHYPQTERPEETNPRILEFLASASGGR